MARLPQQQKPRASLDAQDGDGDGDGDWQQEEHGPEDHYGLENDDFWDEYEKEYEDGLMDMLDDDEDLDSSDLFGPTYADDDIEAYKNYFDLQGGGIVDHSLLVMNCTSLPSESESDECKIETYGDAEEQLYFPAPEPGPQEEVINFHFAITHRKPWVRKPRLKFCWDPKFPGHDHCHGRIQHSFAPTVKAASGAVRARWEMLQSGGGSGEWFRAVRDSKENAENTMPSGPSPLKNEITVDHFDDDSSSMFEDLVPNVEGGQLISFERPNEGDATSMEDFTLYTEESEEQEVSIVEEPSSSSDARVEHINALEEFMDEFPDDISADTLQDVDRKTLQIEVQPIEDDSSTCDEISPVESFEDPLTWYRNQSFGGDTSAHKIDKPLAKYSSHVHVVDLGTFDPEPTIDVDIFCEEEPIITLSDKGKLLLLGMAAKGVEKANGKHPHTFVSCQEEIPSVLRAEKNKHGILHGFELQEKLAPRANSLPGITTSQGYARRSWQLNLKGRLKRGCHQVREKINDWRAGSMATLSAAGGMPSVSGLRRQVLNPFKGFR